MNILLLGILLIGLASCEGNTDYYFIVQNNSSDSIWVNFESVFPENADTICIAPESEETIHEQSKLGGSSFISDTEYHFNYLIITNSSNDTALVDYSITENWEVEMEELSWLPSQWEQTYRLNISDEDF